MNIIFGWPQLTMFVLFVMSITIHAIKHGEPNTTKITYFVFFSCLGIMIGLLYAGGFFAHGFLWPQVVLITWWSISFIRVSYHHGEQSSDHNVFKAIILLALESGLMYAGGFWTNG